MLRLDRFSRYAWGVIFYNLLVILWGAFVRATGSGAGCGSHWPLCNGVVVPRAPQLETIIELSHRITSGLSLLAVVALAIWAFRSYAAGHPVRRAAAASVFFIITESLIGAGLVLLGLTADNNSWARVFSISLHLVNTFFLLAALVLTAWRASGGSSVKFTVSPLQFSVLRVMLGLTILLSMAGAITALGDTLFPPGSLAKGLQQDFAPTTFWLVRLRVIHPVFAVALGFALLLVLSPLVGRTQGISRRLIVALMSLTAIQLFAGAINVLLLAPIWMQLVHLLLADLIWLVFVLIVVSMERDLRSA